MKKILILLILAMALFACSQNAGKKDGVVASVSPAADNQPAKTSSMMPADPEKLIPAVAEKYSGILVAVINKADNTSKETVIPFSQRTAIKGTPIAIEVTSLFPNFKMVDGGYANESMEENNPGAKVKIYKDNKEIFNGWLFQNFPGTHGLDNAQYDIIMVESILK